jgi:hypothetical protein
MQRAHLASFGLAHGVELGVAAATGDLGPAAADLRAFDGLGAQQPAGGALEQVQLEVIAHGPREGGFVVALELRLQAAARAVRAMP